MCVCVYIYCFLINQTKPGKLHTQRQQKQILCATRGKVGRGHLFILFKVIEYGAALLANKIW